MNITQDWELDWNICEEDIALSRKIILIFEAYLQNMKDKGVSKTTFNRHKSSCNALGGYIIEQIFNYDDNPFKGNETGHEMLLHYIDEHEGPLIFQDNRLWQKELDATCIKLAKALKAKEI